MRYINPRFTYLLTYLFEPGPSAPESSTLTTRLPSHPYVSIQLLYRPVLRYIQLSTGFATRDDVYEVIIIHAYTAATHDVIIIVSSC